MNKKLIILTNEFPFGAGENFLSGELDYYSQQGIEVVLVPLKTIGTPRPIPSGISLFDNHVNSWNGWLSAFDIVFNAWFWQEFLRYIPYFFRYSSLNSILFFIKAAITQRNKLLIMKANGLIEPQGTILYSYWLGGLTAGAILFNQDCNNSYKIVSRAHGGDIYDYRYKPQYIPFRNFVLKNIVFVAAVSQDGVHYLKTKYPVYAEKIKCHYLGTHETGYVNQGSADGFFRIVSCSFVTPVKRLALIVESLKVFQIQFPEIKVVWSHLGGGPQLPELIEQSEMLGEKISCRFLGNQTPIQILEFYRQNPVDLFVNTSSSEGIPVAIMEAMSVGIPVLATDVGGVRELVTERCGELLPVDVTPDQIAQVLFEFAKKPDIEIRSSAIDQWRMLFNYEKNYKVFLETVCS